LGKTKLLVNLPEGFFKAPALAGRFDRLGEAMELRKTSYDSIGQFKDDIGWPNAIFMWAWPTFTDADVERAAELRFMGQINTTQRHVRACFKKGIAVSEVRGAWSPAVAEMALGLILTGLRKISQYHMDMRMGAEVWDGGFPYETDPLERQLTGRSVGIVGFGGIGRRLSELLAPFSVRLGVYDPYLPASAAEGCGAARYESVAELAADSEVLVLCAANTEGAAKVVGRKEIYSLRKDSLLVNVGRSMLMDMDALAERLEALEITAMLDVFDKEPLEPDSRFRRMANAYLTPHRAGGIVESAVRSIDYLTHDLLAFLEGGERKYAVTESMMNCFPN